MASKPLAKLKKSLTDDCRKVRFLGDDEETRLRAALDAREERRCAERDSANYWRRERGYVLLPSLRPLAFTDHLKPLVLLSINRSEEHTSELQSLMRISYAVFCLKKKQQKSTK